MELAPLSSDNSTSLLFSVKADTAGDVGRDSNNMGPANQIEQGNSGPTDSEGDVGQDSLDPADQIALQHADIDVSGDIEQGNSAPAGYVGRDSTSTSMEPVGSIEQDNSGPTGIAGEAGRDSNIEPVEQIALNQDAYLHVDICRVDEVIRNFITNAVS